MFKSGDILVKVEGMILLLVAVLLILFGVYLWKKGDSKQSFLDALVNVVSDIFSFQWIVSFSYRVWAVFLWLIGFGILITFLFATISNWF